MRKSIFTLFVALVAVFSLSNCGEKKIEQSAEMTEFVGMIKGQSKDVIAALAKFGGNDDIKTNEMMMYNLSEPVVKAKNGDCYTVDFKAGMTVRTYEICWESGKISTITEKEVK